MGLGRLRADGLAHLGRWVLHQPWEVAFTWHPTRGHCEGALVAAPFAITAKVDHVFPKPRRALGENCIGINKLADMSTHALRGLAAALAAVVGVTTLTAAANPPPIIAPNNSIGISLERALNFDKAVKLYKTVDVYKTLNDTHVLDKLRTNRDTSSEEQSPANEEKPPDKPMNTGDLKGKPLTTEDKPKYAGDLKGNPVTTPDKPKLDIKAPIKDAQGHVTDADPFGLEGKKQP